MRLLRLNLTSIFIFLAFFAAKSQWNPCIGIEGASTKDIILHDSDLFIVTLGNGIFKKNISAVEWDSACLTGGFWKIRSTGDALFCFGPMTNFFRSLDNGFTWEIIDEHPYINDLETVDSCVFIIDDYLLHRSYDNGETWTIVFPSVRNPYSIEIFAQEGLLFCYLESTDSIYRSDDYGESWSPFPTPDITLWIIDIYYYNEKLWLANHPMSGNSVYLFDELNLVWNIIQDSIPENSYVISFFEDLGTICCCTEDGFFYFDEQDSLWKGDNSGLESLQVHTGCHVGDTTWLATASGPFYKYEGTTWIPDYTHLFQREVSQVFTVGDKVYALSGEKIYFSDDVEDGFEIVETQGYSSSKEMIITDSAWYAGSVCGFLISIDSGHSWTAHTAGMEGKRARDIAVTDSFYYACSGGLFRTATDSIMWHRVPNEIGTANVRGVSSLNNIVFAQVYMNGLYRSADYGTSFEHVPESGSSTPETYVKNDRIYMLKDFGPILYSSDSCTFWQQWIPGYGDNMLICMDITNSYDTTIVGGGYVPGGWVDYYLTLFTLGNPWGTDIRDNLPLSSVPYISTVLLDHGRIFASPNDNSLWYRDDFMVGVEEPGNYHLITEPNLMLFPNPVSGLLTINFEDRHNFEEYIILDQSGKIIIRTPCETDNPIITIDVSGLSRGIYFIALKSTHESTLTGKFIKM